MFRFAYQNCPRGADDCGRLQRRLNPCQASTHQNNSHSNSSLGYSKISRLDSDRTVPTGVSIEEWHDNACKSPDIVLNLKLNLVFFLNSKLACACRVWSSQVLSNYAVNDRVLVYKIPFHSGFEDCNMYYIYCRFYLLPKYV